MNFELGKEYIVKVSEEGIIPIEEFKPGRFFDKDHDDLDVLTDEEKKLIINQVLDNIKADVEEELSKDNLSWYKPNVTEFYSKIFKMIDKYRK